MQTKHLLRSTALLVALISTACARHDPAPPPAVPQVAPSSVEAGAPRLAPHADRASIVAAMTSEAAGVIPVFGTTYPAATYCVEDALLNPDSIAVYAVRERPDVVVVHCAPVLDDMENSVAVFRRGESPVRSLVSPERGSCCITDEELERVAARLVK